MADEEVVGDNELLEEEKKDVDETIDVLLAELSSSFDPRSLVTFREGDQITSFNKGVYADKRQPRGTWAPAFPPTNPEKQEAFVEKMIRLDKESNRG